MPEANINVYNILFWKFQLNYINCSFVCFWHLKLCSTFQFIICLKVQQSYWFTDKVIVLAWLILLFIKLNVQWDGNSVYKQSFLLSPHGYLTARYYRRLWLKIAIIVVVRCDVSLKFHEAQWAVSIYFLHTLCLQRPSLWTT